MTKDSDIRDLRSKVRALLDNASFSDVEFVEWLATYAKRGQAILDPPSEERLEPLTSDALRSFRRFANDQKVTDFCLAHKLQLPKDSFWWYLSSNQPGTITGLDQQRIHGIARLTDGIQIWVELDNGSLFLGHREWWKKDRKVSGTAKAKKPIVETGPKVLSALERFLMS